MATDCGVVEVIEEFDPGRIEITGCSVSTQEVEPDGSFTVSVDVSNSHDSAGATVTVTLDVGYDAVDKQVDVGAGRTVTVEETFGVSQGMGDGDIIEPTASLSNPQPLRQQVSAAPVDFY